MAALHVPANRSKPFLVPPTNLLVLAVLSTLAMSCVAPATTPGSGHMETATPAIQGVSSPTAMQPDEASTATAMPEITTDSASTAFPVGIVASKIPRVDPMSGKKNMSVSLLESEAVVFLYDSATFLHEIEFTPLELIDGTERRQDGLTLPIFDIDVLIVDDTTSVEGEILRSFPRSTLTIGRPNSFSVERPTNPAQRIAVKFSVERDLPAVQDKLRQRFEYYLTIAARRAGKEPIAVTAYSSPLLAAEWHWDLYYEAALTFRYDKPTP